MLTRCPECHTYFRIRSSELAAARGKVQCGKCGGRFDALGFLYDEGREISEDAAAGTSPAGGGEHRAEPPQNPSRQEYTTDVVELTGDEDLAEDGLPLSLHEELDAAATEQRRGAVFIWWAGTIVFTLLFCLQLTISHAEQIRARYPQFAPIINSFCGTLPCREDSSRDLGAITILSRDIREHPRFEQALLVNLTVSNKAQSKQPYPDLQLQLFGSNGRGLAGRQFQPEEYLDDSIDIAEGMKPGVPVHIVMEIAGPAEEATSFEFQFR